ncbi:MAG: hypothetical protein ACYSUC_10445 [Planctomycetota bacterium]|jgi:hypothetical protein
MPKWRIYYDDGTTYSDEDGPVENVPGLGVQTIIKPDNKVGREILSHQDFYWYEKGQWLAGDVWGLWDYLQRSGWKKVILGRVIPKEEFDLIYDLALADEGFPQKSAWKRNEHKLARLRL